jgi:hypothetical protein
MENIDVNILCPKDLAFTTLSTGSAGALVPKVRGRGINLPLYLSKLSITPNRCTHTYKHSTYYT